MKCYWGKFSLHDPDCLHIFYVWNKSSKTCFKLKYFCMKIMYIFFINSLYFALRYVHYMYMLYILQKNKTFIMQNLIMYVFISLCFPVILYNFIIFNVFYNKNLILNLTQKWKEGPLFSLSLLRFEILSFRTIQCI